MMLQPLPVPNNQELVAAEETGQLDQHPAVVYLAGLSAGSRRTMAGALDAIAQIVAGDETSDYFDVPWHNLRF